MSEAVLLSRQSDEFRAVEYQLKLGLQGHPASDVNIWKVDNPNANVTFERRTANMLTLDCWTDCGDLDSSNRMDDVCRRGFLFPANGLGLPFHHGNIVLDDSVESFMESDAPETTSGKQNHFYIFSRVAVGRPYIIDEKSTDLKRPEGYDSLYISTKPLDRDQDGFISAEEYEAIAAHDGRDPSAYAHQYVVTDPSQVLPCYVVRFCADVDRSADNKEDNDPMKVYDRYDFFDPVLYQPVSLRDKMIGSHSMGEAATHKLVNLQDAYAAAVNDSKKVDPSVVAKKHEIMRELNKIDSKLRDINLNFATVEENLYVMLKHSLNTLKEEVNYKTKVLLSTELEFRRQLEQLDNCEQWMDRQRMELNETDFLQAWKLHTSMTAKLCQEISSETAILDRLTSDLKIKGTVSIVNGNGDPLMSKGGEATRGAGVGASEGTTDLRQLVFADANAGATSVMGNTKKSLVGSGASDILKHSISLVNDRETNPTKIQPSASTSGLGGMSYTPPNFLSKSESKEARADADAWANSLEKSGLGPGSNNKNDLGSGMNSNDINYPAPPTLAKNDHEQLYTKHPMGVNPSMMPPSPANVSGYQPARVMSQQIGQRFSQYSLSNLATRKRRQLNATVNPAQVFQGSSIVAAEHAENLYYSLPFISSMPETSMVYSTRLHERSIRTLQTNVRNVMSPTMVVVRSGEYVFGGYATDPWQFDGNRAGNPKGFIFSLTLDVKIPYHGRQKDGQSSVMGSNSGRSHDCMWSGPDFLSFGIKDLVLRGDFRVCSSEIEHSYSIGCDIGSLEARSFLAGSSVFVADEIEVWSVKF